MPVKTTNTIQILHPEGEEFVLYEVDALKKSLFHTKKDLKML